MLRVSRHLPALYPYEASISDMVYQERNAMFTNSRMCLLVEVDARAQAAYHDQELGARETCISQVYSYTGTPAVGLQREP